MGNVDACATCTKAPIVDIIGDGPLHDAALFMECASFHQGVTPRCNLSPRMMQAVLPALARESAMRGEATALGPMMPGPAPAYAGGGGFSKIEAEQSPRRVAAPRFGPPAAGPPVAGPPAVGPPAATAESNGSTAASVGGDASLGSISEEEETPPADGDDFAHDDGSSGADASFVHGPDVHRVQEVVKLFVRQYVQGQHVTVVGQDGGIAECLVVLDRDLTLLSLVRSGSEIPQCIFLEDICEVCVAGDAVEDEGLPLDERCVTLMLDDGQAIGFRFGLLQDRDAFALCISMFVDGRRAEVLRRNDHRQDNH